MGIADGLLLLKADELEAVMQLKPKILVLGNEFKNNPEIQSTLDLQQSIGGEVHFMLEIYIMLRQTFLRDPNGISDSNVVRHAQIACRRQDISYNQLLHSINTWGNTRLIVLGDTIVDQYAACEAIGMSAEAPVVVVRELETGILLAEQLWLPLT